MCKLDFGEAGLPGLGADEKLRGRSAVQDYLGRLSAAEKARRAKTPLMIYFYIQNPKAAPGKKAKPSRQANACRTTERLFGGRDLAIGTASKFFILSDVDVTKVDPATNPVFNSRTAPAIALLDSSGNLVSLLSGKISAGTLLRGMMQTLVKSGISAAKISVGKRILTQIKSLENERATADLRRASAEKRLAEAKKKRKPSRIISEQTLLRRVGQTLEVATKALAAKEKLWEELFAKS
jgi:hypothetical protein